MATTTFAPASFYALAHLLRLQSKGDDANLRTSISRAYYGAFIVARDAKGASSLGPSGHSAVINEYRQGDAKEQSISDNLKALKWLREIADYQPRTQCLSKYGTDAMTQSAKVLRALGVTPPSMLVTGAGTVATSPAPPVNTP